jgi:hypothetical protein
MSEVLNIHAFAIDGETLLLEKELEGKPERVHEVKVIHNEGKREKTKIFDFFRWMILDNYQILYYIKITRVPALSITNSLSEFCLHFYLMALG